MPRVRVSSSPQRKHLFSGSEKIQGKQRAWCLTYTWSITVNSLLTCPLSTSIHRAPRREMGDAQNINESASPRSPSLPKGPGNKVLVWYLPSRWGDLRLPPPKENKMPARSLPSTPASPRSLVASVPSDSTQGPSVSAFPPNVSSERKRILKVGRRREVGQVME